MAHRLLVIEDSPTQLITISRLLEAEGYIVLPAKNGAEGLVRAYNESPDLIVSDVVMSGINGYQLCRLIKNEADLAQTPVILLTKLDGSIDRFWGLKSGADRYIPKEPGFATLLTAVRELLSESVSKPRLRVLGDAQRGPGTEEVNSRLHQLLERLLFEATIADEVRRIGDDITDLDTISENLFALLSSVLSFQACALMINEGDTSSVRSHTANKAQETAVKSYVVKLGQQLGLPMTKEDIPKANQNFDNALTQPIDAAGVRLGLMVIIAYPNQTFKPSDQKVVRLISDQLSTVVRLYLSYSHREDVSVT